MYFLNRAHCDLCNSHLTEFSKFKTTQSALIQKQSIQNAIATRLAFQTQITPALTALNIVAESNFGQHFDSEKKPSWLKIINVLLKRNLQITSIYTGYGDNHSFFVRNLHSPTVRSYFLTATGCCFDD